MLYRFSHKTYRLPLRTPLKTAHGRWAEREGIIVRLENEGGRVGFGEIAPIPWFGTETLGEAEKICQEFGGQVTEALLEAVPARFGCVRFALWQARAESTPGSPSGRLPVAALLPAGKEVFQALAAKLEAGYTAFKWKVGVAATDDEIGLLDDLLAQLPTYARLRLDANGAWNRKEAGRWLQRCAERPVEFVEQPVSADDEDTLLKLADDYPVTLALDESVVGLAAARRWQALGWRGVFVMKPALTGPLPELLAWAVTTKADVVFSSAIETALGRSAILRMVLSQPGQPRALGFGTGELFGDRTWDGPVLGPLADSSALAFNPGEAQWNALN